MHVINILLHGLLVHTVRFHSLRKYNSLARFTGDIFLGCENVSYALVMFVIHVIIYKYSISNIPWVHCFSSGVHGSSTSFMIIRKNVDNLEQRYFFEWSLSTFRGKSSGLIFEKSTKTMTDTLSHRQKSFGNIKN